MNLVRKLAHFSEFFLLGLLLNGTMAVLLRPMALPPLGCGLLVAVTDELLQRGTPGRSCQFSDMCLDFGGVLAATLLFALLAALHRRKKKHPARRKKT